MENQTSKKTIRDLAHLCYEHGMRHVVFSPGSRCAPLVFAFERSGLFSCHVVVDERVAGFVALGIAQQRREPVGIICTSGTAVLNYGPAIAEAYYQKLPVIAITADRPQEWIDQADMQSINQPNVFQNFCKNNTSLRSHDDSESLWYNARLINETLLNCLQPSFSPGHINVPLQEPLYELAKTKYSPAKKINCSAAVKSCSPETENRLKQEWNKSPNRVLLLGLMPPNPAIQEAIQELAKKQGIAVLVEASSNANAKLCFENIDRLTDYSHKKESALADADLVITIGGHLVSKKIKQLFRKSSKIKHWHHSPSNQIWDTFQSLTELIDCDLELFLALLNSFSTQGSKFVQELRKTDNSLALKQREYLDSLNHCDFTVMGNILESLPVNSIVQLGNSTPIRYFNLFAINEKRNNTDSPSRNYYSNRGVGGIDGCSSTAVGAAFASNKWVTLITGDLSFLYDSNGLWQEQLPANLRIILINNGGGNIFRIIPGPGSTKELSRFFEAKHQLNGKAICEQFGIDYQFAENEFEVSNHLASFWNKEEGIQLLEIKTDGEYSAEVLRKYFDFITPED
ncbi:2-succinyl-5-enolpyruvyl-6-hydroxy-3-cyclohexene-1-carboxylic-acid synthase [Chitinophagales bacterium]|nr:2-succinyl-5-enolpyruvyl-6-hydroxy-3-cyclohexene-1-carboxylic-acid synthase [Chitinophagales bacterium]